VLDWPEHPSGRPARRANSYVVIEDGELLALLERGGRSALLFEAGHTDPEAVAGGIVTLAQDRPRRFTVERVDGEPTTSSVLEAPLLEQGFVVGYKGLSYRPPSGRGRR
jgi:ATP-dependent Lhr-like helicase